MYESLLDALRRGDAAQATREAREAVAAQPHDPTAHRLLAAALRADGDIAGALSALDTALQLAPENADVHFERAGLLMSDRRLSEADTALAASTALDPNQFDAYIVQGHLALGRGDLDEAERLARTAARLEDDHPLLAALNGMVALRRGDTERALAQLTSAHQRYPEEPTLRHALGFAHLARGHFAFAEQLFRGLLERKPDWHALRFLIADLVHRQGRPLDAAQELATLEATQDSPGLQRLLGELELSGGEIERALPRLRTAFDAMPGDERTLRALAYAWQQLGRADEARETLDRALEREPVRVALWQARLAFEPFAGDAAAGVIGRWLEAMPDDVTALASQVTLLDATGRDREGDALALRITELEPGHGQAEGRVLNVLMRDDPPAAVARARSLLDRATDPGSQRVLRQLLGQAQAVAGDIEGAVATWTLMHADWVARSLPLPEPSSPTASWPPLAEAPADAAPVLFVWGAPGSGVEHIARTLGNAGAPLLADRFTAQPPADGLQRYANIEGLASGRTDGKGLVAEWRRGLPDRGVSGGGVMDWLLWWDNALLHALRPALAEGRLLAAVRDPRDMLLDWLSSGAPAPFALPSPQAGAGFLARTLEHLAELHEQDLYPHDLVLMDRLAEQPALLAQVLGDVLLTEVPALSEAQAEPVRFEPGSWRNFTRELGDAFALLTPVAVRLGYPET